MTDHDPHGSTGPTTDLGAATDAALISQARLGDTDAYEVLVERHRAPVAELALLLDPLRRGRLVDQTFDLAYGTLRRMLGPTASFRTYVLFLVRHLHEQHPDGFPPDNGVLDSEPPGVLGLEHSCSATPFRDELGGDAHTAVAVQFSGLPEAWQAVLWHLSVEGDDVDTVGALIGVAPTVVPALAESAQVTLRRSLAARHRITTLPPVCVAHALRLERWNGGGTPRSVARHGAECERCAVLLADVDALERDLSGVLAGHLLGPAAPGYLEVRRTAARAFAGSPA